MTLKEFVSQAVLDFFFKKKKKTRGEGDEAVASSSWG
jgi:hypothetical protein